jgi:hypothetical protein
MRATTEIEVFSLMSEEQKIHFNGISGVTGNYLLEPMEIEKAAALARNKDKDTFAVNWLKNMGKALGQPHLGLPFFVDPSDVGQAGWAIVFHQEETDEIKNALQPLITHRAKTVTDANKLKVLDYQSGEDWSSWLARHGVSAGNIDPKKIPFYILIIGSPELIPFSFGHLLDVEYAVGRLHFDTATEYAAYAQSVVDYESSAAVPNAREAVFWSTRHANDKATELSSEQLVKPLVEGNDTSDNRPIAEFGNFQSKSWFGDTASKQSLADIFHPPVNTRPPAFLFTASHGMGFPLSDQRQLPFQGALLCQDWPGLGQIGPQHYFGASDVTNDARVQGMIAFHFACYGAGTPAYDRFIYEPGEPPEPIANKAFISALPKRLLSHPNGGALAVIGHVERAWGYSITGNTSTPQLIPFQNAIGRLLRGDPIGLAMKDFNERYAALSTNLSDLQDKLNLSFPISENTLVSTWIERNDAEGYVVLGDPAIRLRVKDLV